MREDIWKCAKLARLRKARRGYEQLQRGIPKRYKGDKLALQERYHRLQEVWRDGCNATNQLPTIKILGVRGRMVPSHKITTVYISPVPDLIIRYWVITRDNYANKAGRSAATNHR